MSAHDVATALLNSVGGLVGLAAGGKWALEWWARRQKERDDAATTDKRTEIQRLRDELADARERDVAAGLELRERLARAETLNQQNGAEITKLSAELARVGGDARTFEGRAREYEQRAAAAIERAETLERTVAESRTRIGALERQLHELVDRDAVRERALEALRAANVRALEEAMERVTAAEAEREAMRGEMVRALAEAEELRARISAVGRADHTGGFKPVKEKP